MCDGLTRLVVTTDNGAIAVAGEIDAATSPAFAVALEAIGDRIDVVLDLSLVTFMGASGLDPLLARSDAARRSGHTFVLRRPSRPVRRVLEAGRLTGEFAIAEE